MNCKTLPIHSSHFVNVAKCSSPLPITNDYVLLHEVRYQAPLCLPNSNVHILNVGMRRLDSDSLLALLNIITLLFIYKTLCITQIVLPYSKRYITELPFTKILHSCIVKHILLSVDENWFPCGRCVTLNKAHPEHTCVLCLPGGHLFPVEIMYFTT